MVDTSSSSSSEPNDPSDSSSGIRGSTHALQSLEECDSADDPPPLVAPKHHHHHHHGHALSAPPHTVAPAALAAQLDSSFELGLTEDAASARLASNGRNVLESAAGVSIWQIFFRQVSNSLTLVLLIAMALSYGTSDWIEGGVITAVICLNIGIGFVQDVKAEKTMQSLLSLSAPVATVIRSGQLVKISSQDIVVGDIVSIKVGDIVPADLRIFDGMNLECDEALLTGESLAVAKTPSITFDDASIPIGDRTNICYSSSTVTKGRGTGIVVATGMHTEVGKIAQMLKSSTPVPSSTSNDDSSSISSTSSSSSSGKAGRTASRVLGKVSDSLKKTLGLVGTPLQVKLSKFAIFLFSLAILLAIIVFSASKWQIDNDVLIYGICVAVAVIPESLIAVLTITLSVATKAMASGHVLVRKMQALEALGGVTDICSDKTGTLTQGKMITRRVWIPRLAENDDSQTTISVTDTTSPFSPVSGYLKISDRAIDPVELLSKSATDSALCIFLRALGLCNLATIEQKAAADEKSAGEWDGHGEPTEISLQVFASRFDYGRDTLQKQGWKLLAEHPFDSSIKRMSVVYESPTHDIFVFTKGAVEAVSSSLVPDSYDHDMLQAHMSSMTLDGLRVLCIAYRVLPKDCKIALDDRQQIEQELSFVGLAGLYDPPRVETRGAVLKAQAAGIKVHMLTGDHPGTARAIAHEVGILSGTMPVSQYPNAVMIAADFDKLSDTEIDAMPELPLVVARCAPATKVKMVDALHRRRAFCVMTGDGVNDSPALKRADVGIAMGLNGSDVAKDASDMILTDDDFASIVRAIEEGRRLFDNIQKFLVHLLISNISQVILLLCGLAFKDREGVSVFPLSPLEILWANMVTSSFLAMGLGMEEAQPDIMLRPPHDLHVGVFTWEVITDQFVYGITAGVLCLASFVIVIYAGNDGALGYDCNHSYNSTCDAVFRARAVSFADLSFLLLITAWEVKHFSRSIFKLDPSRHSGPFSVFPSLYYNRFLFWAVIGGFACTFPVIYIPTVNDEVFKHLGISWEWGVVAGACFIYLAVVEVWKAIKRRFGLWSGKQARFVRPSSAASPDDLEGGHAVPRDSTSSTCSSATEVSAGSSTGGFADMIAAGEGEKKADSTVIRTRTMKAKV
ncbi:sodium transport ATPase [Myxozyma melibiosi]|uniref:P-type Na(+) transporter n=1 Tax=Myxozyma melibiosi TaxID=54550 RepID=A0ABR1FBA0_9ASCO